MWTISENENYSGYTSWKELTLNYLLHEPCKDYMTDECKDSTHKNLTYPEFVEEHYVGKYIK